MPDPITTPAETPSAKASALPPPTQTPTDPIAPVLPAPPPAVSPTGAPLIPTKAVPYALYVVAVGVAITMAPDVGIALPAALLSLGKFIVLLGTLFGITSPGQRKAP